ncbi:hypothetical protein CLAFUW4_11205 [Fulvia fulva]|uniref:Uncharacterized protein n=1 Tax=Passalora fulva TaxID=5499 RepID=A0A9Q8PD03_PASFU|nr:uncharacterized protein CLAFUR5_10248 [Fulvia fulva]KAK4620105.1 hypothetical protein CLAFUR4_11210 [Fulvia fulva]KAK4620787.1 hypothetical protein CLAFUR0_11215 [Fulvia fulva]UJO20209.1 hypothetical protein CLAFUR5_10248 [Fulvia fulva]WPV16981.1 hypothetical protein CLAFUW4_11205 [Fulvia fulva]WPV32024.1 hypothetical protein CLAFUW7_11201 [Fulvia fulva]
MSSSSQNASTSPETQATIPEAPQTTDKKAATLELERLSKACLFAWNDHDFDYEGNPDRRDFRERIAPRFECRIENYPEHAMSWYGLNQLWRDYLATEPNCRFELISMHTDVNDGGRAVLYVEMDVTGVQNVNLIRFLEMKWKVVDGRWMYYSCTTMGGSKGNNGLL